jgi:hypothetical protein
MFIVAEVGVSCKLAKPNRATLALALGQLWRKMFGAISTVSNHAVHAIVGLQTFDLALNNFAHSTTLGWSIRGSFLSTGVGQIRAGGR